jgi:hypothetical protein
MSSQPIYEKELPEEERFPAVTTVLASVDVPRRSHRPTSPSGRQSRSPGTIASQVCHHGRRARVEADESRETVRPALGAAGRASPDQLLPFQ